MRNQSLLLTAIVVLLSACNSPNSETGIVHATGDSATVETVNGEVISQALLEAYLRAHPSKLPEAAQREKALKDLSDYVLLAQEAKRAQYDTSQQFQADVEAARLQAISTAVTAQIQKQSPLSDDMLKADYDQQIARAGKYIYTFTQLLFTDEADGMAAAGEVDSGKPFTEVYETWKKKAKQAKTFPQVRLSQLPEPLAKAMQELKPGETTKVPIKTEFGWHVINLASTAPFTPTSFETVKEAIRHTMLEQAFAQRIKVLREQAQITVVGGAVPAKIEAAKAETPAVAPTTLPPATDALPVADPAPAKKD